MFHDRKVTLKRRSYASTNSVGESLFTFSSSYVYALELFIDSLPREETEKFVTDAGFNNSELRILQTRSDFSISKFDLINLDDLDYNIVGVRNFYRQNKRHIILRGVDND